MRETKFYSDDADIVAGTIGNYSDIVSITGAGLIDHIYIVATATATNMDNYAAEIDSTQYDFTGDLFGLSEINMEYNYNNYILITNKKIVFNTSFKLQAKYNANGNVTFKYNVMAHILA